MVGARVGRVDREDLHEDRRRWHDRTPGERPGAQGRPPDRGLRYDRRAERGARGRPGAGPDVGSDTVLAQIQDELFAVGAALADPDPAGPFHASIGPEHAARLERTIDVLEGELPPLNRFILPGGSPAAAQVHLARTVCRRAERLIIKLSRQPDEHVPDAILIYLNRLSDLLFVLARVVNHRGGVADVPWSGRR